MSILHKAPKSKHPLVSVCIATFNQEKFIEKCLKSVLMQKTNFNYEILIHDDASNDKTKLIINNIVKDMENIHLIFRENNIVSKGGKIIPIFLKYARGKYIALCDGDDYWIDPNKLQKQVDFLQDNTNYSICFHPVKIFEFKNDFKNQDIEIGQQYSFYDLLNECFIHTSSFVFRKVSVKKVPKWFYKISQGDWALFIICAFNGEIGLLQSHMSVYRRHSAGIWTTQSRLSRLKKEIRMFEDIARFYNIHGVFAFRKAQSIRYLKLSSLQRNSKQFSEANYNAFKSIYYWPISKNMEAFKSILLFYFRYI